MNDNGNENEETIGYVLILSVFFDKYFRFSHRTKAFFLHIKKDDLNNNLQFFRYLSIRARVTRGMSFEINEVTRSFCFYRSLLSFFPCPFFFFFSVLFFVEPIPWLLTTYKLSIYIYIRAEKDRGKKRSTLTVYSRNHFNAVSNFFFVFLIVGYNFSK